MKWKAIAIGSITLAVGQAVYLVSLVAFDTLPTAIAYSPYAVVFISGAVTGYHVNHAYLLHLVVLSLICACLLALSNYAWYMLGLPTDLPGLKWSLLVAALSLPYIVVIAGLGGLIGRVKRNVYRA